MSHWERIHQKKTNETVQSSLPLRTKAKNITMAVMTGVSGSRTIYCI